MAYLNLRERRIEAKIAYLGAALALAPTCAWLAIAGTVAAPPLLMSAAVLLWTAGFDILYACQDYESDCQTGVHSVPARFGIPGALWIARASHVLCMAALIALVLLSPQLGLIFAGAIAAVAILLIVEHTLVSPHTR